jgi:transcriptional regulator with XRE-family HTH domain
MERTAMNSITGQVLSTTLQQIRNTVERMLDVIEAPESTPHDRKRACSAIRDAFASQVDEVAPDSSAERRATDTNSQEAAFAEKLHELMKSRGITQVELASRIGCSQPAISQMLKRQCRPQKATILKLASALGVDPRELWPDLDVTDILDTIAAAQQEETMSEVEADVVHRALEHPATVAPAAPLPKSKR